MSFWDRLMGRDDNADNPGNARGGQQRPESRGSERNEDEIAVERYRYLLKTAPPETIEQVHVEAFAKLSPEQRTLLFEQLKANAAEGDRPVDDQPASLARSATRSEMRQPGTLERSLGGGRQGGGMGMGGLIAGSMLGTIAGVVVGSALAQAFLPDSFGGTDAAGAEDGGDAGGGDASADAGGDAGGDSGGGDFGGGDFGGGDFGF